MNSKIFKRGDDIERNDWIYYKKQDGKSKSRIWRGPSKVVAINGKKLFIDQGARVGTVNRDDAFRQEETFWRMDTVEVDEIKDNKGEKEKFEVRKKVKFRSEGDSDSCSEEESEDDDESQDEEESSSVSDNDNDSKEESEDEIHDEEVHDVELEELGDVSQDLDNEVFEDSNEDEGTSDQNTINEDGVEISFEDIKKDDILQFTVNGSTVTTKVISRAGKVGGGNKYWWNLRFLESGEEKLVNTQDCMNLKKIITALCTEITEEVLVVTIPRYQHHTKEMVEAKQKELENWD